MSHEKDSQGDDRRGLVEEAAVCPSDESNKSSKTNALTDATWVNASSTEIASEKMPTVTQAISENVTCTVNI